MRYLKYFENKEDYKVGDIIKLIKELPYDKYNIGELFEITSININDSTFPYEALSLMYNNYIWLKRAEITLASKEELVAYKYNL